MAKIGQLGTLTRGFGIKRTDIIETGYPCIRYGELYTTYKFSFSYAVSYTSLEIWEKSFKVKENDILVLQLGRHKLTVKVLKIVSYAKKEDAHDLYEVLKDEIIEESSEII